ncbi:MAG: tol-pal system protein YbgF [Rickettsiaceae bacterium]|nr:tol-pal system protein YbgF [Rickettsiaceae bacterium]
MKQILHFILFCVIALAPCFVYASLIKSKTFMDEQLNDDERARIANIENKVLSINNRLDKLEKTVAEILHILENFKSSASLPNVEVPGDIADSVSVVNQKNSASPKINSQANGVEKQEYDIALTALKGKDYKGAANQFGRFVSEYPSSPLAANALFWHGEALLKQNIYDKAAMYYLKSYKHSSKSPKAAEALFKLSSCLHSLKKDKEACGILLKLEEEFTKGNDSTLEKAKKLKNQINCK